MPNKGWKGARGNIVPTKLEIPVRGNDDGADAAHGASGAATEAFKWRAMCQRAFDDKGLKYEPAENGPGIFIGFRGENCPHINMVVAFDNDGEMNAHVMCMGLGRFPKGSLNNAYKLCNDLNDTYRWAKFYIDDEDDLCCDSDVSFGEGDCGELCHKTVMSIVGVIDASYPRFVREIWDAE